MLNDRNIVAALSNKGLALSKLMKYDDAIEYFDKALAFDSNSSAALNGKGETLHNLGRHREDIVYYDRA